MDNVDYRRERVSPSYEREYVTTGEPLEERESAVTATHRPAHRAGWLLDWSAIFSGMLIGIGAFGILTLAATAIGDADAASHIIRWDEFTRSALIYSVVSGLVAFFVGGFFASKIAGTYTFESGLLHGALTGFVGFLLMLVLGAIGVQHFLGNFSMGLIAPSLWLTPDAPTATVDPKTAGTARDIASSAVFAFFMLILGGMIGGVLGSESFVLRAQHGHRVR